MKSIFSLMVLGLTLIPLTSFAQVNIRERMDIGVGSSVLANSGGLTHGVNLKYRSREGTVFPVQVEVGDGLQKYSFGVGTSAINTETLNLSIAAALGAINFEPKYDLANEQNRKRFTMLLRNELQIQLSRTLSLGVHADFDIINAIKVFQVELNKNYPEKLNRTHTYAGVDANGNPMWYSNYTGIPFYPDYASKADYDDALGDMKDNQRRRSMTSFGVSLKIDIMAPKKNR